MKLSKIERKFISPAIKYKWCLEESNRDGKFYWDGDKLLPCKVGPVCKRLVEKGLLYYLGISGWREEIRPTDLAFYYECMANGCTDGFVYDDSSDDATKCLDCFGTGVSEYPITPEWTKE